jgi:hypothetical protein
VSDTPDEDVLGSVLASLDMPPDGVRTWLEQNRARCERHGGRRRYAALLELYDACLALLGPER